MLYIIIIYDYIYKIIYNDYICIYIIIIHKHTHTHKYKITGQTDLIIKQVPKSRYSRNFFGFYS